MTGDEHDYSRRNRNTPGLAMNSKGKSKMPEWREFYSLSRGIESVLPDVDNALAGEVPSANVPTIIAHYIKSQMPQPFARWTKSASYSIMRVVSVVRVSKGQR